MSTVIAKENLTLRFRNIDLHKLKDELDRDINSLNSVIDGELYHGLRVSFIIAKDHLLDETKEEASTLKQKLPVTVPKSLRMCRF